MIRFVVVLATLGVTLSAGAGDLKKVATAMLGAAAPTFTLENQKQSEINLEEYRGKIVVLEWVNPDCPFVKRHYKAKTFQTLVDKYGDKDVVWLAVNSTKYFDVKQNAEFASTNELTYDVLDDHKGVVGHKYEATNTPHMYVIDKEGKLAYRGAIDDAPRGAENAKNYVAAALDDLIAGNEVKVAETKAYGCSVKYSKK